MLAAYTTTSNERTSVPIWVGQVFEAEMNRRDDVTLCLTMGKRPEELKRTLQKLLALQSFARVIAINDFRDEPTNQAFLEVCPDGELICLDRQLGHHGAVDYMYGKVQTPYVFHCEDDWLFDESLDLNKAISLLNALPAAAQVCFRDLQDCYLTDEEKKQAKRCNEQGVDYYRIDHLHPQWYGFTFNPSVFRIDLWRSLGSLSSYKKERHISRKLRSQGQYTVYMAPGPCTHIGEGVSVSQQPKWHAKLKAKLLSWRR